MRSCARRMEAHFKDCAHCKAILDGTRNVVKLVEIGVGTKCRLGSALDCKKNQETNTSATLWNQST